MEIISKQEFQILSYQEQLQYLNNSSDEKLDLLEENGVISQFLRERYAEQRGTLSPERAQALRAEHLKRAKLLGRLAPSMYARD